MQKQGSVILGPSAMNVFQHLGLEEEIASHGRNVMSHSVESESGLLFGKIAYEQFCESNVSR